MSKAQFAALLEKKHLVECEEHDYMILQDLFQERSVDTDDSTEVTIVIWYIHNHTEYKFKNFYFIFTRPSKKIRQIELKYAN